MEKIIKLKQDKPILFWILALVMIVPLLAIVVFSIISPALRSYLASSAQKLMNESKQKDDSLKTGIAEDQKKIDSVDSKIDDIDKKLSEVNSNEDLDWHKKKV